MDTDRDGAVTEAEVFAAIGRATAEPGSHLTAQLVIGALDTNHDRSISRQEADGAGAKKGKSER